MNAWNWELPFFTLWTGQAVSLLGGQVVRFALIWWSTVTTGSAAVLATATTVGLLPQVFQGPVAGALVDRWPRHAFLITRLRSLGDALQSPAMSPTTSPMEPHDQLARVGGQLADHGVH